MKKSMKYNYSVFIVWRNFFSKVQTVVNIRKLNKTTKTNIYSMFLQIDIILFCSKCKYISIINEIKYFHQFLIRQSDQKKFIFIFHKNQKIFIVMSFDFKKFFFYVQRQNDIMFKSFHSFCRVYMNDIVIFSKIFEKHFEHLIQIFQFFNNKNIMVFSKKSFLTFLNIILFDQWINNLKMFITTKKIKTILELSFPINRCFGGTPPTTLNA